MQPTPEYKPLPKGVDVATQIEAYEPDLFDQILEVEPVLQVLVGKSVEQARMELIEELERQELLIQKAAFEKKRNAELMVTQRVEAAYVRRKEERVTLSNYYLRKEEFYSINCTKTK